MPEATETKKPLIEWNLNSLYQGPEDPQLEKDRLQLELAIKEFGVKYRGKIFHDALEPEFLLQAIKDYEDIEAIAHNVSTYAFLLWSVATQQTDIQSFKDQSTKFITELTTQMDFFKLELEQIPPAQFQAMFTREDLKKYAEFMRRIRSFKPYSLEEAEERILTIEQQFSRQRWSDFYTQISSGLTFNIEREKDTVIQVSEDQAIEYLRKPDPKMRYSSYSSVYSEYGKKIDYISYIFNALVHEYASESKLRGFSSTLEQQAFRQYLDEKRVLNLLEQVRQAHPYFQRYNKNLTEIMKVKQLRSCDLNSPGVPVEKKISYQEGREIILSAVGQIDEALAANTAKFFDNQWIHASVVEGKTSGAFCMPTANKHAYILLNWNDSLYSLSTLAHELGHGLHFYETTQKQSILHIMPPLFLAETASTFNEYLLTDYLINQESDPTLRFYLLNSLLQGWLNGLFRQSLISDFEVFAHREGQKKTLSKDELCDYWYELNCKRNGKAIEVLEEERFGWARVMHIFMLPFYCYNYTLSNIIVLSLVYQYRHEKESFVKRYRQFLAAGGSQTPDELMNILNLDLNNPNFYANAFQVLDEMLTQYENLKDNLM